MNKLPKPVKNLKNFILGEDAKIIDKTATKIALSISYVAFAIFDANAGGGGGGGAYHHTNQLAYDGNDNLMSNDLNSHYITIKNDTNSGKVLNIDVPAKTVGSSHANHYNYVANGGKK